MTELNNRMIPQFLVDKRNLIKSILFTATFAVIFIIIYQPFGSRNWLPDITFLEYILYSSAIVLLGFAIIACSRVVMYYWNKKCPITHIQYMWWTICEIVVMSLFFTIIIMIILKSADPVSIFKESFIYTLLILLIPYIISYMYLSWYEKGKELEKQKLANKKDPVRMIDFYDEKNVLRLSVLKVNILYIEAADNYVCIYYKNKENISRFLLRNTLKNIDTYLSDTNIVRCHRSYMVNLDFVSVIRRLNNGIFLELSIANVPDIPLTPRYIHRVDTWFHSSI